MAAQVNIFSHPLFVPTGVWNTIGYNLFKSAASGNKPNYFGPWTAVSAYQNYTQNTDIVDVSADYYDLYRVQPIVLVNTPSGPQTVTMAMSRPFFSWQQLFDVQISALLDTFRRNHINDVPVPRTDSTNPQEGSGAAVLPFTTDSTTTRFFLSFLPTDDPIKVVPESVQVALGTTKANAAALSAYTDFFPSEAGGYIDFAEAPPTADYLNVQYEAVRFSNDDLRSALLNAVSHLSLYGINGFQVDVSNNLCYLDLPIPNRDLAEIVCMIAYKNLMNAQIQKAFESAEAWKDGKFEYTADPSRSIQAATMHVGTLEENLRHRCNGYIINTRNYISRGEFESYFDMTGVLPVYSLIVAGTNLAGAMGYWL